MVSEQARGSEPLRSQPELERVPLPRVHEEHKNDQSPKQITPSERDLESDEAVWALYERWCLHHDFQRTLEEMKRSFIYFKKSAKRVLELNQKFNICSNCLNRWSDEPDMQRVWMSTIIRN